MFRQHSRGLIGRRGHSENEVVIRKSWQKRPRKLQSGLCNAKALPAAASLLHLISSISARLGTTLNPFAFRISQEASLVQLCATQGTTFSKAVSLGYLCEFQICLQKLVWRLLLSPFRPPLTRFPISLGQVPSAKMSNPDNSSLGVQPPNAQQVPPPAGGHDNFVCQWQGCSARAGSAEQLYVRLIGRNCCKIINN